MSHASSLSRLVGALALVLAVGSAAAGEAVERRLYTDTAEASSFLWGDWNRFIENYHPNYVGDDDAKTAWVEGSAGSGAGEWLRLQVTPLEGTTTVRLKIRNGYQKSKGLFAANARAKDVVVRLLPSKTELKATLTDKDGWQELTIAQPAGPMRAVELKVGSVYEGSKYKDLCISDVQVFATATTPDNPGFEKNKKKALLAWRAARLAAAKAYGSAKVALPLHPSYQVTTTEVQSACSDCDLAGMLAAAAANPKFKEWKDALAMGKTVIAELDTLPAAQLAPVGRLAVQRAADALRQSAPAVVRRDLGGLARAGVGAGPDLGQPRRVQPLQPAAVLPALPRHGAGRARPGGRAVPRGLPPRRRDPRLAARARPHPRHRDRAAADLGSGRRRRSTSGEGGRSDGQAARRRAARDLLIRGLDAG